MALENPYTQKDGQFGNYWRIKRYAVDDDGIMVIVQLYKSKAYRNTPGAEPMPTAVECFFTRAQINDIESANELLFEDWDDVPLHLLYLLIKENPPALLVGATDSL